MAGAAGEGGAGGHGCRQPGALLAGLVCSGGWRRSATPPTIGPRRGRVPDARDGEGWRKKAGRGAPVSIGGTATLFAVGSSHSPCCGKTGSCSLQDMHRSALLLLAARTGALIPVPLPLQTDPFAAHLRPAAILQAPVWRRGEGQRRQQRRRQPQRQRGQPGGGGGGDRGGSTGGRLLARPCAAAAGRRRPRQHAASPARQPDPPGRPAVPLPPVHLGRRQQQLLPARPLRRAPLVALLARR